MTSVTEEQFRTLMNAIAELRETYERGFRRIHERFDEFNEKWDLRIAELERRWQR
ncbi:MAG TPA: hypothetical protein VKE42_02500 [Candidatus Cybelea sp.]|nr:hypothetical protein [Candidatus Cybelea sp.]